MTVEPIRMKSPRNHHADGGVLKIKRGGAVSGGNNGASKKRMRTPVRALRDKTGAHLLWPVRGKPIWDPNNEQRRAAPNEKVAT